MGYHRAGFEVVGVDNTRQPHYPFRFVQQDWRGGLLEICEWQRQGIPFAIHASPPCQSYTRKSENWGRKRTHWTNHPDLLSAVRDELAAIGVPYVIENVPGSPIDGQLLLCGSMFGLKIIKHRIFEGNWAMPLAPATCNHTDMYNPWQGEGRSAEKLRAAQDTPWIPMAGGASRKAGYTGDAFNAIPPAYTEFIGSHLLRSLE
jgi:DNA (cytosine-5)-methyltransferase 1